MSDRRPARVPLTEAIVLGAVLLDLCGFGMLLPDIQFRAERLGMPGWAIGATLTVTFVIQLLVSPGWGRVSDRLGRKPILIACSLLSAAGLFTYGLATAPLIIVASRTLSGFGGANVSIAQAYMADVSTEAERTAAMGRIGAAVSAGLIIGSASLALPVMRSVEIGFVAGACSGLGVFGLLFLPRAPRAMPATAEPAPPRRPWFDMSLLHDLPELRNLVVVAAIAWFSLAMLEGTFGRLIERTLGFARREFGEVFAVEAVVGVLAQGVLLAWLAKRTGSGARLRTAYAAQAVGLLLMPFAPSLAALFGAGALYSAGSGIANGTVNGLSSVATPNARQGELFGLLQGARSIGFAVGPTLGGALFDWNPRSPYIAAGATCVLAALVVHVPRAQP